jgi:hypothetical protein
MACFDCTYLLQLNSQSYDRKNEKVSLVEGAWSPWSSGNASVELNEEMDMASIKPATDMFLVSASVCFLLLYAFLLDLKLHWHYMALLWLQTDMDPNKSEE